MYQQHFGLTQFPFALTPDTEFFFRNRGHVEALEVLRVAMAAGEGFIKVTGEVGTGKTLLCRTLMNGLGLDWISAYVPNPQLSPHGLRLAIARELGVPDAELLSQHTIVQRLQARLIELAASNLRVAVVIDEAQALSDDSLEALRLLSNLETEKEKLLHVVLFGQPELDLKLESKGLRQLRQRIAFSYRLAPLDCDGVRSYLEHRLRVAGYNGGPVFGRRAVARLHRASGGVPRLVNVLAHKALMLAFGHGAREVGVSQIDAAARDTESARQPPSWPAWPLPWVLAALTLPVALLGVRLFG